MYSVNLPRKTNYSDFRGIAELFNSFFPKRFSLLSNKSKICHTNFLKSELSTIWIIEFWNFTPFNTDTIGHK